MIVDANDTLEQNVVGEDACANGGLMPRRRASRTRDQIQTSSVALTQQYVVSFSFYAPPETANTGIERSHS
jgi:hypothetical protein